MLERRKRKTAPVGCSWVSIFFLIACSLAWPQTPPSDSAVVTFTCDFPGSDPSHYMVSVSAAGHGSYVSNGKVTSQSDSSSDDSFHREFAVSPATAARIFDLAKQVHYFEGEIDSKKKNLASTGTKTLAYKNGDKSAQATYNYSPLVPVEQLTTIFQDLSATLEFGQRLEFDLQYQKLALNEELKNMEEMASHGELEEVSAIAPILQKIAQDASVMNVARARAQRLLETGKTSQRP
jgi:hypothetical protein